RNPSTALWAFQATQEAVGARVETRGARTGTRSGSGSTSSRFSCGRARSTSGQGDELMASPAVLREVIRRAVELDVAPAEARDEACFRELIETAFGRLKDSLRRPRRSSTLSSTRSSRTSSRAPRQSRRSLRDRRVARPRRGARRGEALAFRDLEEPT